MTDSRGYWLPVFITVAMHLGLFFVLTNDWTLRAKPLSVVEPIKAVQATLVTLKKEKPKPRPVKPKIKPKPTSQIPSVRFCRLSKTGEPPFLELWTSNV